MPSQTRRTVRIGSGSRRKKDAGCLFASPIGLALDVDDSDDWPPDNVFVLLDDFTNTCGKRVTLFQPYLPMPCTRKACVRIRNNAEESCVVVAKRRIRQI